MSSIILSFRSRTVTSQAYNFLSAHGITCALVATPREAYVGCGLSVQFSESDFASVTSLVSPGAPTFIGYFRVSRINGKRIVTRI